MSSYTDIPNACGGFIWESEAVSASFRHKIFKSKRGGGRLQIGGQLLLGGIALRAVGIEADDAGGEAIVRDREIADQRLLIGGLALAIGIAARVMEERAILFADARALQLGGRAIIVIHGERAAR